MLKALKITLIGVLMVVLSTTVHSRDIHLGFKAGYTHQQSSYLEGGILFYGNEVRAVFDIPSGFYAGYAGWDFSLRSSDFISGPSLAYEVHYGIVCGRLHSSLLTDFRESALQFSAEGGLTFLGWFYCMAGYNFTVSNKSFVDLTGFKISAGINLYALREF